MTYIKKMVERICVEVLQEYKRTEIAAAIVEKIIADTKRACCDAAEDALDHNHTMCDWCVDAIAACEVKGE